MLTNERPPDAEDVRAVHRQFVTGVTIVTVMDGDTPRGLAVNAFMSLTLEPPQVMVAVQRTAGTYPIFFANDRIAINIASDHQGDIVRTFASKGIDKFAGLAWHLGEHGAPLLDGSAAHLECFIQERIQANSHTVFIARILRAEAFAQIPLVYTRGQFASAARLEVSEDHIQR